jgi:formylglycine-generating enzyme required for sulfatase activity
VGDMGWGRGTKPVTYVTWHDAKQYAAWLSQMTGQPYRLLSEAEWEYTARAGTESAYPWGDEIGTGNANCNGCGSIWGNKTTSPVGSFKPNAFGLYDMHGNVKQWGLRTATRATWLGCLLTARPVQPATALTVCFVVVAGGNYYQRGLRSAGRMGGLPDMRNDYIGFRVARTLVP